MRQRNRRAPFAVIPLAGGTWAVPWYDMPSRMVEPATMTDAAVDASTPGAPALPEIATASSRSG